MDIARLLSMEDMWRFRKPPIPLNRNSIMDGSFEPLTRSHDNISVVAMQTAQASGNTLRDQRELSLRDNVVLFDSRYV